MRFPVAPAFSSGPISVRISRSCKSRPSQTLWPIRVDYIIATLILVIGVPDALFLLHILDKPHPHQAALIYGGALLVGLGIGTIFHGKQPGEMRKQINEHRMANLKQDPEAIAQTHSLQQHHRHRRTIRHPEHNAASRRAHDPTKEDTTAHKGHADKATNPLHPTKNQKQLLETPGSTSPGRPSGGFTTIQSDRPLAPGFEVLLDAPAGDPDLSGNRRRGHALGLEC